MVRKMLYWSLVYLILTTPFSSFSQETDTTPVRPVSSVNPNKLLEQAAKDATLIQSDVVKPFVLLNIVKTQAQIKAFSAAFETVTLIRNEYTVSEALLDISIKQAEAGDIKAALKTAEKIHKKSLHSIHDAIVTYSRIAEIQTKAGDRSSGKDTFDRAVRLANFASKKSTVESHRRLLLTDNLLRIASSQIRVAERRAAITLLDQALEATIKSDPKELKGFGDPVSQRLDPAMLKIAGAYAQAGDIKGALKAVDVIKTQGKKEEALRAIVRAAVQDGKVKEAHRLTTLISRNPNFQRTLRITLMIEQARRGDIQGALKTFDAYYDSYWDRYLFHIVREEIKVNGPESALRTAKKVHGNIMELCMVAVAYAETGDEKRAKEVLRMASDKVEPAGQKHTSRLPSYDLSALVNAQARIGDFDGALNMVGRIKNSHEKILKLINIAQRQIDSKDRKSSENTFQRAKNIAESLRKTRSTRADTLRSIGVAQWKAGFETSAKRTLKEALESAVAIRNISSRPQEIVKVVIAQAEVGDAEAAYKIIEGHLPRYQDKQKAIEAVASVLARRGNVKEALAYAHNQEPTLRAGALLGIVQAILGPSKELR